MSNKTVAHETCAFCDYHEAETTIPNLQNKPDLPSCKKCAAVCVVCKHLPAQFYELDGGGHPFGICDECMMPWFIDGATQENAERSRERINRKSA